MRALPPRLPERPIFYPVTTAAYAIKIAREMALLPYARRVSTQRTRPPRDGGRDGRPPRDRDAEAPELGTDAPTVDARDDEVTEDES